jgi:hypothetical protein
LQNHFAEIDPRAFAAYLAAYKVQYVVVMPDGYDFFGPKMDQYATQHAAFALLQAAGWKPQITAPQAVLFVPGAPPPDAAEIAAYAALRTGPASAMPPDKRARLLKHETRNVCAIRALVAALSINPAPLLGIYATHVELLVPPQNIACGAKP